MEKNCKWQESECRAQVMPEARTGVPKSRLALAQLRGHPWKGEYTADTPWCFNNLDGRFGRTPEAPAEVAALIRQLWLLKFRPMGPEADSAR